MSFYCRLNCKAAQISKDFQSRCFMAFYNDITYVCLTRWGLYFFVDLLSLDQSKTFYKPDWFDIVGAEVKCCKEAVCVIDMSSFTKFELTVSHEAPHILL